MKRIRGISPEIEWATRSVRASGKAVREVAAVLRDGRSRTDAIIWVDCRRNGYRVSQDTVRHARLALYIAGNVVALNERWKDPVSGATTAIWRRAGRSRA